MRNISLGPKMQQAAIAFVPFESFFEMSCLGTVVGQPAAKQAELDLIPGRSATGPLGYNMFKGPPDSSRQIWFLKRNTSLE